MRGNKRYIFLVVSFLIFFPIDSYAQDLLWSKNYGGSYNDGGNSCLKTSDGGYVALGSTYSYGTGDHDIYLLKLDSLGDTLWTRTFGGSGTEYGYDIQGTVDGCFIIVGKTRSFGAGMMDVYLIKTDSLGLAQWTKTFGGAQNDDGMSVRQTADSGFIVCGTTNSFGAGYADVYLIKTNSSGDILVPIQIASFNETVEVVIHNGCRSDVHRFANFSNRRRISVIIHEIADKFQHPALTV